MRLGLDYKVVLLILLIAGQAWAGDMFIGMRPYGATDIGTLQSTDSIPIDRIDATGNKKTTPAGISSYVYSQINGLTAPAFHNHSTATSSRDGYQSSTDKGRFDAMYSASVPTSATEGAIGSGTWTSLATAGYTVETAQAKWPYLTSTGAIGGTHLITGSADLAAYGVDWAALQNGVYKASSSGGTFVLYGGTHVVERSLVVGSVSLIGSREIDSVYGDMTSGYYAVIANKTNITTPIISVPSGSSGTLVKNIRFQSATVGISATLTNSIAITNNEFYGIPTGIKFINSNKAFNVEKNKFISSGAPILFTGTNTPYDCYVGGCDNSYSGVSGWINGNSFTSGHGKGSYGDVAINFDLYNHPNQSFVYITNNHASYYDTLVKTTASHDLYEPKISIKDNFLVSGDTSYNPGIDIKNVGHVIIDRNFIQNAFGCSNATNYPVCKNAYIKLDGNGNVSISNNTFFHSNTGAAIWLTGAAGLHLSVRNNLRIYMAESYGVPIISDMSSAPAGATNLIMTGNDTRLSGTCFESSGNVADFSYLSNIRLINVNSGKTYTPSSSAINLPVDVTDVLLNADYSTSYIRLPYIDGGSSQLKNKTYKIRNMKGSTVTISLYPSTTGLLCSLAETYPYCSSSTTISNNAVKSFVFVTGTGSGYWQEITP